jgi:hypothetical protein
MPSMFMAAPNGAVATANNLTGLNSINAVTIAFWYRRPTWTNTPETDLIAQASTANVARDGFYVHINNTSALSINIQSATASSTTSSVESRQFLRNGLWAHYAITFDDATNLVRFYVNGSMITTATNTTDMTANASCQTRIGNNAFVSGFGNGWLFDVQILPEVAVSIADILPLMNPRYRDGRVRGRWFGLSFRTPGASGTVYDESGNGNNLVAINNPNHCTQDEEPPYLPTLA